ncbi:hypothetical protein KGD82_16505 [Nocardiopsis eucommiae]|uniref:Uncharacterized protein n=1 Tax=Nocardiopsis eucommiae TaxID=2831970 RepID=A0A975L8A3_9ACTN|nr:hypothetical protein KGD82_16505 [Nocardiopsis eucommiae]
MPHTPAARTEYPRPEFVGRDDELINFAEAARRAQITTGALSNWRRRHTDFPKVAKLDHSGPGRAQKFIPADEFDAYLARHQEGNRPRRHPAEVASQNLRYYTKRVQELEDREAALSEDVNAVGRPYDVMKLEKTRAALTTARALESEAVDRLTNLIF